jgi:hypothetical protein
VKFRQPIQLKKEKLVSQAGVNLLYRLMDKIGIEFGVLYSTKGQKVHTARLPIHGKPLDITYPAHSYL